MIRMSITAALAAAALALPAFADEPAARASFQPAAFTPAPIAVPARPASTDLITPEELAALLPADQITPETDIRPYLRAGVPVAMQNEVLRRVWVLNQAIRNHVGLLAE